MLFGRAGKLNSNNCFKSKKINYNTPTHSFFGISPFSTCQLSFNQKSNFTTFRQIKERNKNYLIRKNDIKYLNINHPKYYSIADVGTSKFNMFSSSEVIQIDRYSEDGFTIQNIFYDHSLLIFSEFVLKWKVYSAKDFSPDKFALITHFHPAIDTLILGTGENIEDISPELKAFFEQNKLRYEVLDSKNAVTTFNFLMLEGRRAAAAVVPINNGRMKEKYPSYDNLEY